MIKIKIRSYIKKALCVLCAMSVTAATCIFPLASDGVATSEEPEEYIGNIFGAGITELSGLLDSGAFTSQQLCEYYIERIKAYDKSGPKLNSVIYLNKNAVEIARVLDAERAAGKKRGVLHGVPILVKDSIDVAGFPTSLGLSTGADSVCDESAAAVKKLTDAGAIILGKTNLSTNDLITRYTYSDIIGETRNVYNTALSSGGSSGGCAVAVSADFAAAALSTDTNSSLLYPAALCGVVAFRPTHSLIDYSGCGNVVAARDTVATTAKTVADCAIITDILTEGTAAPCSPTLSTDALRGKTVAVIKELSQYTYNSLNEFKNADKEIQALFEKSLDDLRSCGANVVTVSVPRLFSYYYNACRESSKNSSAAKEALASELESLLKQNGASAFVFPSYLSAPLPSGFENGAHKGADAVNLNCGSYLPALAGLPAVNVPMGFHSSKAAVGLEMVSLRGTDAELLSLSYCYEQATHKREASALCPNLHEPSSFTPVEAESPVETEEPASSVPSSDNGPAVTSYAVAVVIAAILVLCVYTLLLSRRNGKHF